MKTSSKLDGSRERSKEDDRWFGLSGSRSAKPSLKGNKLSPKDDWEAQKSSNTKSSDIILKQKKE